MQCIKAHLRVLNFHSCCTILRLFFVVVIRMSSIPTPIIRFLFESESLLFVLLNNINMLESIWQDHKSITIGSAIQFVFGHVCCRVVVVGIVRLVYLCEALPIFLLHIFACRANSFHHKCALSFPSNNQRSLNYVDLSQSLDLYTFAWQIYKECLSSISPCFSNGIAR